MKYSMIVSCALLFLSGCNKTGKALHEKISNADSVAINFFKGDGTMDTVVSVKIIRNKATLEKLTGFITAASASIKSNCGYDGSIHYFKNNMVIQDIDFRMNSEDCSQFSFLLNGEKAATKLPVEARAFLTELKK